MALNVEGLTCLRGERLLFDPLSFSLKPGEGLFVRGANGAGKSSLLKLLAGLLRPYAGEVTFGGRAIFDDLQAYRRNITYLGHLDGLKPGETAGEAVEFRALLSRAGRGEYALSILNMHPHANTPIRYLSAGQRRRVALAGVLATGATLWLLDEPTTALDGEAAALVYTALAAHLASGGMFVVATHDDPPEIAGAAVRVLT